MSVRPKLLRVLVCAAISAAVLAQSAETFAAETVYVRRGGLWRFAPGTAEASEPDTTAWREVDFDDSEWAESLAPFGYGRSGDPVDQTDMNSLDPPMQRNYSSLYLRKSFELTEPEAAVALHAQINFDDGFIIWINGVEVARANAPFEVRFDARADGQHESGEYEPFEDLPNVSKFLRLGKNVVAVQAFNTSPTSGDFKFDVELVDPFGPDLAPPQVSLINPPANRILRNLDAVQITFDEEVLGVDASDLILDEESAVTVEGEGAGPYTFRFDKVRDGEVSLSWIGKHGITDASERKNAFSGGSWSYSVDSNLPEFDLVLSEFAAVGADEDWIEIWNRGVTFVDLAGWSLTDDSGRPDRWVFPAMTLAPGEYLLVEASGVDQRDPAQQPLSTNFKLARDGEYLGLFPPGVPRSALSEYAPRYPAQRLGISYGVDADGRRTYFEEPSPGESNRQASIIAGVLPAPLLSAPRGVHTDAFPLTITSPFIADVYYTVDGSEPTPKNGSLYDEPILVEPLAGRGVAMIRAAAFRDGFLSSEVVTRSFLFPDRVLTQATRIDGLPTVWGTQPADYAMDARVVQADRDEARAGLLALPTVSVVTDVDHLFHRSSGIYANPSRQGFEVPVSLEFLYPDGSSPGEQVNCGLRVQGGSSTGGWKSIKVSMRAAFRGDYGSKKLRFPVFPDSSVDTFDSIVLDAHLNLAYTHPDHGQRVRSQFVRDIYIADLQRAAGGYAPHGRFMHLYLNGVYWGMYDVHERPDNAYASEHIGGSKEEWDIYRHSSSRLVDGTSVAWNEMFSRVRRSQTSLDNYLAVQDYLDVSALCDYMAVNFYGGNTDWAHQNWYAGRLRRTGEGYRFFSWDAEHTLKSVTENVVSRNDNGGPTELHQRLRQSPEYRTLFGDRAHRLLSEGGAFYVHPTERGVDDKNPQNNVPGAMYMRRINEIWQAVVLESARWGDARRPGNSYTRDREFVTELNGLRNTYFPNRSRNLVTQLQSQGLYPRVAAPSFSMPQGQVELGALVAINASEGSEIYVTSDGSDPREFGTGDIATTAVRYSSPIRVDDTMRLKARVLDDGDWSPIIDNLYTVVSPADALRVTEIHYHPEPGSELEFVELTNTSDVTVDLSDARFIDAIEFVFPDPTVLGSGERLVLVSNAEAFAASYPEVEIAGQYEGALSDGGERLVLADRFASIILLTSYGDGRFWNRAADGYGFSLVWEEGYGEQADSQSWRASSQRGGSPGAVDAGDAPHGIVISEILARSTSPFEDAIEIYNAGSEPVDLGGWYLSDDRSDEASLKKFEIPEDSVIGAGEFLVFYEAQFNTGETGFALGADGDEVFLSSARDGELTGLVTGFGFSASLENISFGLAESSDGQRFVPLAFPTFGVEVPATVESFRTGTGGLNAEPRVSGIVINEIHYHPQSGFEFIELHNSSQADVHLYNSDADAGWRLDGIRNLPDNADFEFPEGVVVPPGGFVLVVPTEPEVFVAQVDVPETAIVVGPYRGSLDNAGERLRLLDASVHIVDLLFVSVDEVRFDNTTPWPTAADGQGASLERIDASRFADDSVNWEASTEAGGTPGRTNSVSDPGVNQRPFAQFTAKASDKNSLRVNFDASASFDPDGAVSEFLWDFGDGNTGEGQVIDYDYAEGGVYEVILSVVDKHGANDSAAQTIAVFDPNLSGQRPGDANQDAQLNISDAISLLDKLFLGGGSETPCEGKFVNQGANLTLLDMNVDARLDLTDAVYLLNHLFRGGPAHGLGSDCVAIAGCAEICNP